MRAMLRSIRFRRPGQKPPSPHLQPELFAKVVLALMLGCSAA
jgi:hypothetical protein